MSPEPAASFGDQLRAWRTRRHRSQLDLALAADVSARHVSFLETGRSAPSRAMVLRLADTLEVPLREQNLLLTAAGYAAVHTVRRLDDPAMAVVRAGLQRVLRAFEPHPCVAVDGDWALVAANDGAGVLLDGVAPHLLEHPNALRIALHPDGMAPRIRNLAQWRLALIGRLRREVAALPPDTASGRHAAALLSEITSYPGGFDDSPGDAGDVVVPLEYGTVDGRELRLLNMVTTFGTARDLTAGELSIEVFLPADEATAAALR